MNLSPENPQARYLLSPGCTCTVLDVPVGGGPMWDELMELVTGEPTLPEASTVGQSVVAGRLNDDGTYVQYGARQSRATFREMDDLFQQQMQGFIEEQTRIQYAAESCEAMGLQIVREGDDISQVLGIAKPSTWLSPGGIIVADSF